MTVSDPPTIKRRKSWPSWSRWYAEDEDGSAYLFAIKPSLRVDYTRAHYWMSHADAWLDVKAVLRAEDYATSLRSIVP